MAGALFVQPSSARGTKSGHALAKTVASGDMAFMASGYALLLMVPSVPITPIRLFFVSATAILAPGSMTPMTGMESFFLNGSRA